MKSAVLSFISASLLALPALVSAQLSGTVGPTTSTAAKAATKVCNILNYGGVASASTDNGAALLAAWTACKSGGEGRILSFIFHVHLPLLTDGKSIFPPEAMVSRLGSPSQAEVVFLSTWKERSIERGKELHHQLIAAFVDK